MTVGGILETALYVRDLDAAIEFYRRLFDFKVMLRDDRFCAFDVVGRDVLLLFKQGGTTKPMTLPGGVIPPHDGQGTTHLAFSVKAADLPGWEKRLADEGIAVESTVTWPAGGTSVYFRDLDDHLLELATPGIWPNY